MQAAHTNHHIVAAATAVAAAAADVVDDEDEATWAPLLFASNRLPTTGRSSQLPPFSGRLPVIEEEEEEEW